MKKIIEYYGIPACGKSTISHQVAEKLREIGLRVDERAYLYGSEASWLVRILFKIKSTIWVIWKKKKIIIPLFQKLGKKAFGSNKMYFKQFVNACFVLYVVNTKQENFDVCIMDQGIAQFCGSVAMHTMDLELFQNTLQYLMKEQKQEIYFIYLKVNPSIAYQRIQTRKNGHSRMDLMHQEEFLEHGMFYQKCEDILLKDYKTVTVQNDNRENAVNMAYLYSKIISK